MVGGCLRGRATEREASGPGRQASPAAAGPAAAGASGAALGGRRARGVLRSGSSSCAATCGGAERSGAEGTPPPPLPARRSPRRGLLAETSWSSPLLASLPRRPRAPARRLQTRRRATLARCCRPEPSRAPPGSNLSAHLVGRPRRTLPTR